jgi:hypothetical protein
MIGIGTNDHGTKSCRPSARCRRGVLASAALAVLLTVMGCSTSVQLGPSAVAGLTPSGTVNMDQVQVAYIGSAGGGSGTLYYQGAAYPFNIGGLGIGGIGASTIDAEGEVYKLNSLAQFPGTYGQARYGFAIGNMSGGDLWMQNESGVIMHLKAKRTGLMLSLGGDAVLIKLAQ